LNEAKALLGVLAVGRLIWAHACARRECPAATSSVGSGAFDDQHIRCARRMPPGLSSIPRGQWRRLAPPIMPAPSSRRRLCLTRVRVVSPTAAR
jgi:hypothetical protein